MSAVSLQPQPLRFPVLPTSVRSQRPNGGSFQVVSDEIWVFLSKKMQAQPAFVFVAAAAASCCSSAHYDSLSAQGRAGDFSSGWKTVVDSAAAILMYERSLRADHILRGVSWSRSSNSHLQLDLRAVRLKYEITVCTCEADLTFKLNYQLGWGCKTESSSQRAHRFVCYNKVCRPTLTGEICVCGV